MLQISQNEMLRREGKQRHDHTPLLDLEVVQKEGSAEVLGLAATVQAARGDYYRKTRRRRNLHNGEQSVFAL